MVKSGYKVTAAGIIPEKWSSVKLLDEAQLLSGLTYTPANVREYGLFVIRSSNVQNGNLSFEDSLYVDCEVEQEKLIHKGDIILCVRNGSKSLLGKCAISKHDYNATFGAFMAVLRSDHAEYLFQLLSMGKIQKAILRNSEATINQITKADIEKIDIPMPDSENEIRAITETLSDVDGLILSLRKIIEKKQNFFQACVDQLFPRMSETIPQVRLSGYTSAWRKCELGDIAVKVDRKAKSGSIAPIMMISAAAGFIDQNEKYSEFHAGSSLKNYTLLYKDELAYNHGFSKIRNFGSCFCLRVPEARIPFVYHTFAVHNADPRFIAYYLNSGIFDGELKKRVTSTARMDGLLNISYSNYMSLPLFLPSLDEQKEIGDFLENTEILVNIYKKKLIKAESIKQRLMEELLTGKVRLV